MPASDLTSRHQADGAVLGAEMSWSGADKVGFGRALQRLMTGLVRNPGSTAGAVSRYAAGMTKAGLDVTRRSTAGQPGAEPAIGARDRRFNDPAWNHNPFYGGVRDAYSLFERLVDELVEASGLTGIDRAKAIFACPASRTPWHPPTRLPGNPDGNAPRLRHRRAERRAWAAQLPRRRAPQRRHGRGRSTRAVRGRPQPCRHPRSGGLPQRADRAAPVRAADRADLHEVPLLLSPPWINKYYIMDLAPGRSFAEWAVHHGHTTFVISYRNPDESMRDVDLGRLPRARAHRRPRRDRARSPASRR